MIGNLCSHHDIHHIDRLVGTAGNTGVDNNIYVEIVEERESADSCIHFSNAALHYCNIHAVDSARIETVSVYDKFFWLIYKRQK